MKVFVITNSSINNYGAIIQAFALQKKLIMLGADACLLRKINPKKSITGRIYGFLSPRKYYTLKDKLLIKRSNRLYSLKASKLHAFYFQNIRNKACHSLEEASVLISGADALIAGSDQIWSPDAHMLSEFTTLQFGPKYIKRYSYAASVGVLSYNADSECLIKKGLKNFSEISVRESSSVELIRSLTDCPVRQNIDPTLLFDADYWNQYTSERLIEKPYVFAYILRPEPLTIAIAKKIATDSGKELYVISNRVIKGVHNVTDAGIEEWLSYIKNADYVITNSFHGTAFSVIFKKQFLSIAIAGSGMRVVDFLSGIGLDDRIAKTIDDLERIDQKIEWGSVDKTIFEYRQQAEDYLKGIVDDCETDKGSYIKLFRSKGECCGCGACVNVCPRKAIFMTKDNAGFMYPEIDRSLCVQCGRCKDVCGYRHEMSKSEMICAYAAVSTDNNILSKSASGGIFGTLAKDFLRNGGIVYGCAYVWENGKILAAHKMVQYERELKLLQSSKYVQSDLKDTYTQVKKLLDEGKQVLYSGTPCQIAGLRGFLKNIDTNNLYTIDIICHGVPSAMILQSYIDMIERQKKIKILDINFRDKKYKWGVNGTIYYKLNGSENIREVKIDPLSSSYYKLYLMGALYRENCYTCPFNDWEKRPGDITIGDYWGIDMQHPELLKSNGGTWDQAKGISCILINSEKGKMLIKQYGSRLDLKLTSFEKVVARNKMLIRPTYYFQDRSKLLNIFETDGYEGIDRWFWKRYRGKLIMLRIRSVYHKLPVSFRRKIKNVVKKCGDANSILL